MSSTGPTFCRHHLPKVEFFACGHCRIRHDLDPQLCGYRSYQWKGDPYLTCCSSSSSHDIPILDWTEINNTSSLFSLDWPPIVLAEAEQLFTITACPLVACQRRDISVTGDLISEPLRGSLVDQEKVHATEHMLSQYEFGIADLVWSLRSLPNQLAHSAIRSGDDLQYSISLASILDIDPFSGDFKPHENAPGLLVLREIIVRMRQNILDEEHPFILHVFSRIAQQKLISLNVGLNQLRGLVANMARFWLHSGSLVSAAQSDTDVLRSIQVDSGGFNFFLDPPSPGDGETEDDGSNLEAPERIAVVEDGPATQSASSNQSPTTARGEADVETVEDEDESETVDFAYIWNEELPGEYAEVYSTPLGDAEFKVTVANTKRKQRNSKIALNFPVIDDHMAKYVRAEGQYSGTQMSMDNEYGRSKPTIIKSNTTQDTTRSSHRGRDVRGQIVTTKRSQQGPRTPAVGDKELTSAQLDAELARLKAEVDAIMPAGKGFK